MSELGQEVESKGGIAGLDAAIVANFQQSLLHGAWDLDGLRVPGAGDAADAASAAEFDAEYAKQLERVDSRVDLSAEGKGARALAHTIMAFRDRARRQKDESEQIGMPVPRDVLELWTERRLARLSGVYTPEQLAALSMVLLVSAADFAQLSNVPMETLAAWRQRNIGPSWVKLQTGRGAIMYPMLAIREWLESREVAR